MQTELQHEDLLNLEDLRIVKFGTFWPRFWALLIDGLILSVLAPLTIFNKTHWKSLPLLFLLTIVQLGYKSFFEFTYGATPGKMAMRLKVVNNDLNKATFAEILLRNIFQIASVLLTFSLAIYTFTLSDFALATTVNGYTNLQNLRTLNLVLNLVIFILYIVDLIVMLSSDESKSLHDRIGRTLVIRT